MTELFRPLRWLSKSNTQICKKSHEHGLDLSKLQQITAKTNSRLFWDKQLWFEHSAGCTTRPTSLGSMPVGTSLTTSTLGKSATSLGFRALRCSWAMFWMFFVNMMFCFKCRSFFTPTVDLGFRSSSIFFRSWPHQQTHSEMTSSLHDEGGLNKGHFTFHF